MGVEHQSLPGDSRASQGCDLNHDGRLSFEEFQSWYRGTSGESGDTANENATVSGSDSRPTLKEVREVLRLGSYSVEEVFARFADESGEDGSLDEASFMLIFKSFAGTKNDEALPMMQTLFGIFADSQGKVDFCDLASGLSILCGGSAGNRVAAAFSLYDYNGDGFISLDEMTRFLTCVFKVLFEVSYRLHVSSSPQPTSHFQSQLLKLPPFPYFWPTYLLLTCHNTRLKMAAC